MTAEQSKVNILVVDDEPGIRDLLSFDLASKGYQVVTAKDGLEALECVKKQKFQVMISDLMMPNMDGMKTLEEVKKIDPSVEVIIATGYGTLEKAVDAIHKGAYDFIQKPFNMEEIFMLIEKALEKGELKTMVALYEASKILYSTVDLKEILKKVMELVQKVLQADEGSIMLLDSENHLYIAASQGIREDVARNTRIVIGEGVAGKVAQARKPVLLIDGIEKYPQFQGVEPKAKIRSSIVCPLICQNELLGILNLNRTTVEINFTDSDLKSASVFAFQVAQAIQNAKLYKTLKEKNDELRTANQNLLDTNNTLKKTQAQLVHAEKSLLIDQLAVGVAHEIKNPLAVLLQGVDYLSNILKAPDSQVTQLVQDMRDAVQKADLIIRALMDLAASDQLNFVPANLHEIIEASLGLVENELESHRITVTKIFDSKLCKTTLDRGKMTATLVHLFKNSVHAMPKGGELTVKTQMTQTDHFPEGAFAIEVIDGGKGIPEDLRDKIFDPFVTTKRSKGGIGLGLSTVKSFVDAHKGTIEISARRSGSGTHVIITLPCVQTEKKGMAPKVGNP